MELRDLLNSKEGSSAVTASAQNVPSPHLDSQISRVPRPIPLRPHQVAVPFDLSVSPGSNGNPARRARTNVSIACDGCKLRRAKCDGKSPCSGCLNRSLSCSYNPATDRRRNRGPEAQMLTRKLERYQRLVHILRSASPGTAVRVLQHLRCSPNQEPQVLDTADDVAVTEALRFADHVQSDNSVLCSIRSDSTEGTWTSAATSLLAGHTTSRMSITAENDG